MAALVLAAAWLGSGFGVAVASAAVGLAIGVVVQFWARRRGVDRVHVPTRYAVAGTLAVIVIGTAIAVALR
jgi:hypothetical protein